MTKFKVKFSSLVFLLLFGLSGASLGFLIGRSHNMADETTTEIRAVTTQVSSGGAVIVTVFRSIRDLLIQ